MQMQHYMVKYCTLLLVAILLVGCSDANQQIQPTQDPVIEQVTIDSFKTQAAATVFVDMTQIASSLSGVDGASATEQLSATEKPSATIQPSSTVQPFNTRKPTPTPLPSATPVPPTKTASPEPTQAPATATHTATFILLSSTALVTHTALPVINTQTSSTFKCALVKTTPGNDTKFPPNQDFDLTWTLQNTGKQPWSHSDYDIAYLGGTRMFKEADRWDMQQDIAPGQTMDVFLDMVAPKKPGDYSMTWGIVAGSTPVCVFSFKLSVGG